MGNRVGKLALGLNPRPVRSATPPTLDRPGIFARETGGQRKYLGPKKGLLTFCLRGKQSMAASAKTGDDVRPRRSGAL